MSVRITSGNAINHGRFSDRSVRVTGRTRENRLPRVWLFLPLMIWAIMTYGPCVLAAGSPSDQGKGVVRATLANGLRIVIVQNKLSPVVVTVVNYLVGSDEAPKGFPGMAHAQEHMMFRGSPGLTAGQLAKIMADMGGKFDADTQQHVTRYYFTIPAEDLDVALHIEAIRMRGILDSEKLWSQERKAIEQEVVQDLSNPDYVFYKRLLADIFKGTPYEHDALGTRASFNKTTAAMLRKFHETWYVPNNAIVVIVGDVQPEHALAEVTRLFGTIPARKLPPRTPVNLEPVTARTIRLKTDQSYGTVLAAFRMPGYDSPDYAAAKVLADVLSSERGSLYDLVIEGKALDAGFEMEGLPKAGIGYAMAAFPKGADVSPLRKNLQDILSTVRKNGVPADLVEAAKKHKVTSAELEKNSVSGLAMAWSKALAVEGRHSPQDDVNAIRQVTVEDVNRVARIYLDPDHCITAILTPQPSGKPVSSKGFGGKESFTPKHVRPVEIPGWAEKSLKKLTVPESTLHPEVSTLPNGIRLIVQPVYVSDTVTLCGHVRNMPELEVPPGKEGVDEVLDNLFSFGTTSLDRRVFLKALDDIGAIETAGTTFTLQVLSDQLDPGVRLLADNVMRPALPEGAFKIIRGQVAGTVAGRIRSPDYLAERAVKKALYPENDPTRRQATPRSVSALKISDVRDYYHRVFRPDMTTIVVIGKVTPDRARAVVGKYFGEWKAPRQPKPDTLLPPVPANKPSNMIVPDSSRIQDKVVIAETLGLTRSDPDYYALQLGNHILGGAFYATRLYRDLREYSGLVYFVASSVEVNRTRGVYKVEYACNPPDVGKARAIVVRNLKDMQSDRASTEEMRQAKALLLRKIPLSESSVDDIAVGFIRRTELDLPLDEPILAARRYAKIDAEEVRAAYAKWLRPQDLIQVTQGPNPK